MNTDIRVDVGFLDHWKTDTLISELGESSVLALMRVWIFAAQNKPDGVLTGIQESTIERIAKWRGEPGSLTKLLVELRFIEKDEAGVWVLHDWERHNPYAASAEFRHERAKKANAARRDKEKKQDDRYERATSAQVERYEPAPSPSPAPSPAPSPSPSPSPAPAPEENPGDERESVDNSRACAREETPSSLSAAPFSPDFKIPDDWWSWATQERPDLDIKTELANFVDHYAGKVLVCETEKVWRKWIRNANPTRPPAAHGGGRNPRKETSESGGPRVSRIHDILSGRAKAAVIEGECQHVA